MGGSENLIFSKLINLLSLEQFHHKCMVMYGDAVLRFALGVSEVHPLKTP